MSAKQCPDSSKINDVIDWASSRLDKADVFFGHGATNAMDEAVWMLCHVTGWSFEELDTHIVDENLSEKNIENLSALLDRRIKTKKPLAYLLNEAWFCGLKFYVDERVLVPRSLIGEFIEEGFHPWFELTEFETALDIGTGSGCIAIALTKFFPKLQVDASDISESAIAVAEQNIKQHLLEERIQIVKSDLFSGLNNKRYDLIISNPPYVPEADIASFPEEYRHEPRSALASGEKGLDAVSIILEQATDHLTNRGWLVVEVGETRERVEQTYADLPLIWPSHSSGLDNVFFISANELKIAKQKSN